MSNKFKCPQCEEETKSFPTMLTHLIYRHDVSPSQAAGMLSPHNSQKDVSLDKSGENAKVEKPPEEDVIVAEIIPDDVIIATKIED